MKRKIIVLIAGAVLAGQVPAAGQGGIVSTVIGNAGVSGGLDIATASIIGPEAAAEAATVQTAVRGLSIWQKVFGWQTGANWTENLYNSMESLLNMDMQLEALMEQNKYLSAVYNVGTLITEDPIVPEIYNELNDYYYTVQNVRQSIQDNLLNGTITPQKATNVMRSLVYPETLITEDIAWMGKIMMRRGEEWPKKIEALKELKDKMRRHRRLTELIYQKEIKDWRDYLQKQQTANVVNKSVGLPPLPTQTVQNELGTPVEASLSGPGGENGPDPVIDDIVKEAEKIGKRRESITLRETKEALGQARQPALDIASIIIGIMASIAVAFAYSKRHRGEHQSADALYKVFAGLVFAIIGLQIVQAVIMNLVK